MTQAAWRPSLRTCLVGIVLIVLTPILGVIGMAILNAGQSYQDASTQQLQETAQVVAHSVDSEMDSMVRLVSGLTALQQQGDIARFASNAAAVLPGSDLTLHAVQGGQFVSGASEQIPSTLRDTILSAAATELPQLSNIDMPEANTTEVPRVLLAVPVGSSGDVVQVATLLASPVDLIRSLMRDPGNARSAILAVTDGSGRILARSVDGAQFVGRPVPDWQTLQSLNSSSGHFRARTIEGNQIVFAFQAIVGTPGWMAVVGEPAATFDARWQEPIRSMVIASTVTVLFALVLAALLASLVLKPISHLVKRAQAVASGRPEESALHVPSSFVAEFETLRQSLDLADAKMQESLVESHNAERIARESLDAMAQAERLARIGSWTLDLETQEFGTSAMLYELNGADPDGPPLTVADLGRLLTPESNQRVQAALANCVQTGEPYGLEVEHMREGAPNFYAYIQGQRICDENGRPIKLAGTVQDITERREERDRLTALADNLPSGAIFRLSRIADEPIQATYVSAGIERLIGVSPSEITADLGGFLDLVEPEDRPGLDVLFDAPGGAGQILDHAFRISAPARGLIWLHIRAALRAHPDGHLVWDGIIRDVTMEQQAAETLHAAKEAAISAERAKSDFLATMSHEIRTPMNTVIGMTRLALQTNLDGKQRNYLEKINSSAVILLGIINDILDFSKIEANGLQLEKTTFSVDAVLESVSAVTALRADEKGIELAFAIDPAIPSHLKGDPLRLGQVLTNLVGNAVKFTESGDILVSIRPRGPVENGTMMLEFAVKDTGIGLTEDQIDGLFRPFTQAESDTSRKYGGTGLGLAICKRLVELMGGDIRVDSEPGLGSTFIFTASLAIAENEQVTTKSNRANGQMRGRRILIIDDNHSARGALLEMVASFGMVAQSASSGAMGLQMLREAAAQNSPYEMVLLDWRMPGMDGIQTAELIKADQSLTKLPAVLMVTAYGHDVVARAVQDIGLQGILLKPITQSVMFNAIMGAFEPADRPALTHGQVNVDSAQQDEAKRLLKGRRVLVVDDSALNREVATDFLELVGVNVTTAVDGQDAIEIMEREDFDVVLMDMHMPRMDGLEAVREIRRRSQWAELPVIALTAQARVEDHRSSLEAGMTAHLTKPIDEVALYVTLIKVLGLNSGLDQQGQGVADVSGRMAWSLDIDAVSRRFGGNQQRVERLVHGFLRDFNTAPEQVVNFHGNQDKSAIAELVHQIKASAGYVGATELAQVSDSLERAARDMDDEGVAELVPHFSTLMSACLVELRRAMETARTDTATEALSAQQTLALVLTVIPLVRGSDFAARDLLEALMTGTTGTPSSELARTALEAFDQLDIDGTVEALEAIAAYSGQTGSAQESA